MPGLSTEERESQEAVEELERVLKFRQCRYDSPPPPPSYEEAMRTSERPGLRRKPEWVRERERAEKQFRALSFPGVESFPRATTCEWDEDIIGPRLLQNPDE